MRRPRPRSALRWLVAGVVVLAVVAVGAVAVVAAIVLPAHRSPTADAGPSSPPVRSSARPLTPAPAASTSATPSTSATATLPPRPPDDRAGPVLLVPGYGGNLAMLSDLTARLRRAGRTVIVVQLPDAATGDLHGQEKVLASHVDAELAGGAHSVDLVGYSAGGIVVALFAEADPAHVRRIVTLGSPLHGTRLAGIAANLLPSACPIACQQMAPDSPLIASLKSAFPAVTGVPWLSVWTADDEVVTPPSSAHVDGARNVELQDVCADDAATHISLPTDALAIGLTLQALSTGPVMASPSPADCARLRALGG